VNEPFAEVPGDFDQHVHDEGHDGDEHDTRQGGGFLVGKVVVNASDDGVGRQLKWRGRQVRYIHQNSSAKWNRHSRALAGRAGRKEIKHRFEGRRKRAGTPGVCESFREIGFDDAQKMGDRSL
jgi:hypothetical protein